MAKEFHKGLVDLKLEVINMAFHSLNMLQDSMKSLYVSDRELAKLVISKKHELQEFDNRIEDRTLKLIALYQPMAKDLRKLGSILKIITYLTRIGRYGKDIAQIVKNEIKNGIKVKEIINIQHIYEHVRDMIKQAIEAFEKEEIRQIENFSQRDDEVDKLRWSIFRECTTIMMENPKYITVCAHYMMIARYLERCADHACKIAEKTYYMVTGNHKEFS